MRSRLAQGTLLLWCMASMLSACGGPAPAGTSPASPAALASTAPASAPAPSALAAPTTAQPRIDPCSLLTKGEAETALAVPLPSITSNPPFCHYKSANGSKTLDLDLSQLSSSAAAASRYSMNLDAVTKAGGSVEQLQGIGEKAYYATQPVSVMALKSNFVLRITEVGIAVDGRRDVMVNLAAKAVARLP